MDYEAKRESELQTLKLQQGVNDPPASFHYLSEKFLAPLLKEKIGVKSVEELVVKYVHELGRTRKLESIEIASIGSGNAEIEIGLALHYHLKCRFTCYEGSSALIRCASETAARNGVRDQFAFKQCDVNQIKLKRPFDIILAHYSLHHFTELEHIFFEIQRAMTGQSYLIVSDMIGRNGHLFWDATLALCNRLWKCAPKELKHSHSLNQHVAERVQLDGPTEGDGGPRAQQILPLLNRSFRFKDFATFYSLVNRFVDRDFGPNFDTSNSLHRNFLDLIWEYDNYCLEKKILKPTQIIASLVRKDVPVTDYRYTYFADASEISDIDESSLYRYFDV